MRKSDGPDMNDLISRQIKAQAAVWLARLHSEDRTASDVAGFQAWLEEDVRHRDAFETLTSLWEAAAEARPASSKRLDAKRRALVLGGGAAAAAAAIGSVVAFRTWAPVRYQTGFGEQRTLALDDGSQVTLDTNTAIRVGFGGQRRSVDLLSGRAHFVVAKDPTRPFVVTAGERQVIAVGTAFDVAREGNNVSVVLVEGKVVVRRAPVEGPSETLEPGDRVTFRPDALARQDRPDLSAVTAWHTGQAVFDDDTLSEAVAELNRYQRRPLVIADASVGAMRISGSYRTGNSEAFAKSVSALLPINVSETPSQIILREREHHSPN